MSQIKSSRFPQTFRAIAPIAVVGLMTGVMFLGCVNQASHKVGNVIEWGDLGPRSPNFPTGVVSIAGQRLADVKAISAGLAHSLALKMDGTVVAWGWDGGGRTTGYGTNGLVVLNGQVLSNVVAVAAGQQSLALLHDSTVIAWGLDFSGRKLLPPLGLSNVVAIAAGQDCNLALKSDGTVVVWGDGPSPPRGLTNVIGIALSRSFHGHGLALTSDGSVTAWGLQHDSSSKVTGATNVIAIAAGRAHFLALKKDGTVVEWGRHDPLGITENGIVGAPAIDLVSHSVTIDGKLLTGVVAIAAGQGHSLALKRDGTVVSWGGMPENNRVPSGLRSVVAISAGDSFSIALTTSDLALPAQ